MEVKPAASEWDWESQAHERCDWDGLHCTELN